MIKIMLLKDLLKITRNTYILIVQNGRLVNSGFNIVDYPVNATVENVTSCTWESMPTIVIEIVDDSEDVLESS